MPTKERATGGDKTGSHETGSQRVPAGSPANDLEDPAPRQTQPADMVRRARQAPRSLTPGEVLGLQSIVGNRAVGRLLSGRGRRPAIQARLAAGPTRDPHEQEADRVAEQVMRSPAPAARIAAGDRALPIKMEMQDRVVQRIIKLNGVEEPNPPSRTKDEESILRNWGSSRIEHDFQGRTRARALGALQDAVSDVATKANVPPPLFRAENLKFLTQDPARLPTLYFKQGISSGRIRQQHPAGPAVKTENNKIDYFFADEADLGSFENKARQAKAAQSVFPPEHSKYQGAHADPASSDFHMEVTYKADGKIQKTHVSGGRARPDVKDYSDWQIELIYKRAIGRIANLRIGA